MEIGERMLRLMEILKITVAWWKNWIFQKFMWAHQNLWFQRGSNPESLVPKTNALSIGPWGHDANNFSQQLHLLGNRIRSLLSTRSTFLSSRTNPPITTGFAEGDKGNPKQWRQLQCTGEVRYSPFQRCNWEGNLPLPIIVPARNLQLELVLPERYDCLISSNLSICSIYQYDFSLFIMIYCILEGKPSLNRKVYDKGLELTVITSSSIVSTT